MTNSPHVGARLEEVPPEPNRSSFADLGYLSALLLISFTVHAWLYCHTFTTARDSIGFAQLALQYESPTKAIVPFPCKTGLDVAKYGEPPQPPGYPLIVLAVSQVTRGLLPGELPEIMLRSTQIASMLGGILLVFPSFSIGSRLFGRQAAFAATALFQVLPVAARTTSDGLTEAWYLVFLAYGIRSGIIGIQTNTAKGFFLAGFFGGMAYLVRPEGLLVPLTMVILAVVFWLLQQLDLSTSLLRVILLVFGTAIPAAPYMMTIGAITKKNAGNEILLGGGTAAVAPLRTTLFASSYDPDSDGSRFTWAPKVIFKEASKTFHYGPIGFTVIGLVLALRTLRSQPGPTVLMVITAINLGILYALGVKTGYLSERHTLPIAFYGMFFCGHGMFAIWAVLRPYLGTTLTHPFLAWLWLIIFVGACIPVSMRALHENRAGHKILGEYLKQNATMEDVIIDPYNWAQYYSERSLYGVPPDPTPARYRFAVLEDGEAPHSKMTRLEVAQSVQADTNNKAIVVCEWLDTTDVKKTRKIVLLRQDTRVETNPPAPK